MNIKIYEPPLCCSTGVCGPEPDKQLIELQNLINLLSQKGITIDRYAINQQPIVFTENDLVKNSIKEYGVGILPITMIGEDILKTKSYPTIDDFKEVMPDMDKNSLDEIKIQ